MTHVIVEDGERAGTVETEGGFDAEYTGSNEEAAGAIQDAYNMDSVDTGVGPGGEITEEVVDAEPGDKLDQLSRSVDGVPGVYLVPEEQWGDLPDEKGVEEADHRDPEEVLRDPGEPTTNSLALKGHPDRGRAGDRVYVDSAHDAPEGKVVHSGDDGLYYVGGADNPDPVEPDSAEEAVGLLEKLRELADR